MIASIVTINSDSGKNIEYLLYLVNSVKDISDDIYLCISKNMESELWDNLSSISDKIFSYSSYIDINRWRDILLNHIDRSRYDYVLLANDSSYGPIYPLTEAIQSLKSSSAQLWGISSHGRMEIVKGKSKTVWPRFVQTHFFALRKEILCDDRFVEYLERMPYYTDFQKASEGFEFSFTKQVEDWGYTWDTYIDTKPLENDKYFMSFILFDIYRMISKERYPFLPKVLFDLDNSVVRNFNAGYDIKKSLEFIDKRTDYDVNLIIDDLIQKKDPSELLETLNLYHLGITEVSSPDNKMKCAIFSYLYYEDLIEDSLDYIFCVPNDMDVFISTDTKRKAEKIKQYISENNFTNNVKILLHENKGRDLSALLVLFRPYVYDYDLFCFMHDKKSSQMVYSTVGADFNTHMWNSLLGDKKHVEEVINEFKQDDRLGLLSPPMVSHGMYFHTAIDSWTICYDKTIELMKLYDINATVNGSKNPLSIGSAFWARTKALKKLFDADISYEDFPDEPLPVDGSYSHCMERIFPYVAADAGYYSGIIMNNDVALNIVNNDSLALNQILRRLDRYAGFDTSTLHSTLASADSLRLKKKKYDAIFKDSRNIY